MTDTKKKSAARKTSTKKAKAGRPSKFKDEFCELATNYCLMGATDEDLATFFNVTVSCIDNWKATKPEFLQAIKEGKEIADAKVGMSLYQRATGYTTTETKLATYEGRITDFMDVDKHYPPDPTSMIFWLKNRRPDLWREKQEVVATHEITGFEVVVDE